LRFNNTLKDIHAASDALWVQVSAALLPALQQLATSFANAQKNGGFLKSIIPNLITDADIYQVQQLAQSWENLVRIFSALKALPQNIKDLGIVGALDQLDDAIAQNKAALDDLARAYANQGIFKGFLDNLNEAIKGFEQYANGL